MPAGKNYPIVKAGAVTERVGVEVIRARGVDVEKLIKMLIARAAAEFASTYTTITRFFECTLQRPSDGRKYSQSLVGVGEMCHSRLDRDLRPDIRRDPRTYDMAAGILNEEIEDEALKA